jgi:hypothetical protein
MNYKCMGVWKTAVLAGLRVLSKYSSEERVDSYKKPIIKIDGAQYKIPKETSQMKVTWGRDSSVGIAARYGLDGSRIEYR